MAATKQIRHMVRFNATPRAIYRALMDSKKHAAFTGAPAKIDPKVGGRFAAWGQHLCGVNVELIKNKRIVQAWRAQNWPAGHYSIATFELKAAHGGTVLVFTHTASRPPMRKASTRAGRVITGSRSRRRSITLGSAEALRPAARNNRCEWLSRGPLAGSWRDGPPPWRGCRTAPCCTSAANGLWCGRRTSARNQRPRTRGPAGNPRGR